MLAISVQLDAPEDKAQLEHRHELAFAILARACVGTVIQNTTSFVSRMLSLAITYPKSTCPHPSHPASAAVRAE
jgi:hypothetical protein